MNSLIEPDLGPLSWVKSEIDLALARADESLEQAAGAADALARVQFAQTHLHQARGAFSIVGLDGLAQFASALDQLLGAVARGECPAAGEPIALARRALAVVGNYLEELAHGTPDQPLRLFPHYAALSTARGAPAASPVELFFPDVTLRPPRRKDGAPAASATEREQALRLQRTAFERGLLLWLRDPAQPAAARSMGDAIATLETLETHPQAFALWWAARALFDALEEGALTAFADIKRPITGLHALIRRLPESPATVPERLMREVLYWISQAPARSERQRAVRSVWQLDALLPEAGATVSDTPLGPLLKALQGVTAATKLDWDDFCCGQAAALPSFESRLAELAAGAARLGRPALDRLLAAVIEFVQWLRKDPLKHDEVVAIEVAAALLLCEAALDRAVPDGALTEQVVDTVSRLRALSRGEALPAAEGSVAVETARRAQEREAQGQLSREILSSLAQVEQTLDDYFRNQQKRGPLATLEKPLKQIEGALALLGEAQALGLVHEAAATVARFAATEETPDHGEFEHLAQRLSALGFYVQALQHGSPADLDHFLDPGAASAAGQPAEASEEPALEVSITEAKVEEAPPPQPRPPEPEAAQTEAQEIPALEQAPGAQAPQPEAAEPEIAAFEVPAADIAELSLSASAVAEAPAAAKAELAELHETVEALHEEHRFEPEAAPRAPALPEPAADTQKLAAASTEEIDAELLAIFIEEAHDVLATIGERLDLSRTEPDGDHLTAIRRSFHTLKGSGRMVGLRDLGEAAWGLEQTLNRWLQFEWPPSAALHHLIDSAHHEFSEWVAELEAGGSQAREVSALLAEAERLRSSETPIEEPAPLLTPSPLPQAGAPLPGAETVISIALGEEEEPADADAAAENTALADFTFDDLAFGQALADAEAEATTEADRLGESTSSEALPASVDHTAVDEPPPALEELSSDELTADDSGFDFGDLPAPGAIAEAASATGQVVALPTDTDFETIDVPTEGADEAFETPRAAEAEILPSEETVPALLEEAAEPDTPALTLSEEIFEALDLSGDDAGDETGAPLASEALSVRPGEDRLGTPEAVPDLLELGEESLKALLEEASEEPLPACPAGTAAPLSDQVQPQLPAGDSGDEIVEALDADDTGAASDFVRVGDIEVSRPLYDLYCGEARHHLAVLHGELARLQANPTRVPPEVAARSAHTLAGISGTARILPVHTLARALEHAIERLHHSAQAPAPTEADLLVTTNATLEAMLSEVEACQMPLPVPELEEQLDGVAREHRPEPSFAAPGPTIEDMVPAEPAENAPTPIHDDIDEQLLPVFLEEGAELVSELHATLRSWRSDSGNDHHANATARLLHTLKGSARMAGAMALGEHVHQMESRLEVARKRGDDPAALVEEMVTGLDQAEQLIDLLVGGGALAALPATKATDASERTPIALDPASGEAEAVAGGATLRVRAETVDRFVNAAGEIGIARSRIEGELRTLRRSLLDLTENVIRLRNQLREVELQADVQMQSRIAQAESRHAQFDPLEMDRYTRLQELTRMMAESVGDVTTVQQNLLRNLDAADLSLHGQARLSRDLQQALMRVRMVPFDSLADRLYRIVRQTAKELGKRANLDLRGGRIEVDRGVLEHMTAPLEHLLRNAVAHGIEPAEARRAAGKDEIGQITLDVRQEGNEVVITLTDDGAGLDYARIAERARANGLLAPDEAADERRLTNLIFVPGFSTAGNLSTVSGRGVGMDVVKSETAAVGGRIDVASTAGRGSQFRVYLPLTLAVTQAVLVRAGGLTYAIPSSMIAQVMELKAEPMEALRASGGTEWQGEHFAYRYLPHLLGDPEARPELQRFNWVLLLRAGAQTLALHVDALRGNQEIVVKNAGPQLVRIVGISGATVLGDGEIVLILNPVALASRSLVTGQTTTGPAAPAERQAPTATHPPTVMVVDDSLTVRKITGRLLEREGYRVVTAKDGVDALERLLETLPDVILSDIEMPRMDGFDLLRNIRADERTRAVPVIMITSRLADKHRDYATRIGADHYLGKPYDEAELLALLRGYVANAVPA